MRTNKTLLAVATAVALAAGGAGAYAATSTGAPRADSGQAVVLCQLPKGINVPEGASAAQATEICAKYGTTAP